MPTLDREYGESTVHSVQYQGSGIATGAFVVFKTVK